MKLNKFIAQIRANSHSIAANDGSCAPTTTISAAATPCIASRAHGGVPCQSSHADIAQTIKIASVTLGGWPTQIKPNNTDAAIPSPPPRGTGLL